jgi:hypothetical protein
MAATLASSMQGAAVRPQFAKSVRRGSRSSAYSSKHSGSRTTLTATAAVGPPPKFAYMSRDTQRHDKLVALLDAELEVGGCTR